ncbi:pyrimidine reductase [Leptospira perolatii]|uniref:Pyrimidine reductase n=1 Tax=Leptospira perolatii TaxID=2023191 RepID=A0A2M9ZKW1_9LEPT|nr:RibD family protein [Leptospira perolatii]PJZ69882.1 pyrimidine reductase [Leptospira perolatii]PJZ72710.1 pyrimidine reductase [Leptospira perolatii]
MSRTCLSVNMAMTLDGKVCRPDGKWYGLSSRNDKRRMDQLRAEADALLLGKNSLLQDDPVTHLRYVEGKSDPRPVILIRTGTLPVDRKVFRHSKTKPLVYCTEKNAKEVRSTLSELTEICVLGPEDIESTDVLRDLGTRGYSNVLLEGGPRLNDSFFRKNLVDKINLTIVPFVIGQEDLPSITGSSIAYENFDLQSWKLIRTEVIEDEIFLQYERRQ